MERLIESTAARVPMQELSKETTTIRKREGWARLGLGECWRHRELLLFLSWREFLVRYKQTAMGAAWALVRPVATMVAFVIVFGHVAKLPSEGVPYPLVTFVALVPWQLFAGAFNDVSISVVGQGSMLTKVYFPRLLIPLSALTVSVADFILSFVAMLLLTAAYGRLSSSTLVFVPFFFALCLVVALGPALWFAALYVKYRDVRQLIPFLLQTGLFLSPIGYMTSALPERWRGVFQLNPMVTVVEGFRWCVLGTSPPGPAAVAVAVAVAALFLAGGLWYFQRTERQFADVI